MLMNFIIENLLNMGRWTILTMVIIMFAAVSPSASVGSEKGRVMARGDGIEVTAVEVKAMRNVFGGRTSRKGLLEGAVKMVLFAKEALQEKVACPSAAEVAGFKRTIALANCYLHTRLDSLEVRDGAVESYYRTYWRRFVNRETGELAELDTDLRQEIKERILTAKKKHFGSREYERLCEKYNIVFTENGS